MAKIEKRKVWTAVLLIPPLVLIIALGSPLILTLMVFLIIVLGLREFYNLAIPHSGRTGHVTGILLALMFSILFAYGNPEILTPFIILLLLILCTLFMITSQNLLTATSNLSITFFGIFYIGFLLSHVILIRNQVDGKAWLLFLMITIWSGDIFALFSGILFGRHKLYPKISPNKTYEGLFGAIFGSVVTGLLYATFFLPNFNKVSCILVATGMGILGQLGDFIESLLKRSAQVKDSGSLFPGHGGVLDRIDSFLFSSPFLYYLLPWLSKETL